MAGTLIVSNLKTDTDNTFIVRVAEGNTPQPADEPN